MVCFIAFLYSPRHRAVLLTGEATFTCKLLVQHLLRDHQGFAYNPVMVTVADDDGTILRQNPSSIGFYGYLSVFAASGRQDINLWDILFAYEKVRFIGSEVPFEMRFKGQRDSWTYR